MLTCLLTLLHYIIRKYRYFFYVILSSDFFNTAHHYTETALKNLKEADFKITNDDVRFRQFLLLLFEAGPNLRRQKILEWYTTSVNSEPATGLRQMPDYRLVNGDVISTV
jgi:hypothetical protein